MTIIEELLKGDFMPHGHCLLWRPDLLGLHVGGDVLTTLAYMLIPMALIQLVRKRDDLAFDRIFMMFAAFIFLCGVTHAIDVFNIWHGYYYIEGLVKLFTGLVSMLTAFVVWRLLPTALAVPSTAALRASHESLKAAEAQLREANASLEQRVKERTLELEKLAVTDPLTGVWNRREIMGYLSHEAERSRRHRHPLSVMMIDMDHFKKINDVYGHQTGDAVLIAASTVFTQHCRKNDEVGRYGGEEFLILLPDTTLAEAKSFAERIRHEIEMLQVQTSGETHVETMCSIGVAQFNVAQSESELIRAADDALYRAKTNGRNQVVCAQVAA